MPSFCLRLDDDDSPVKKGLDESGIGKDKPEDSDNAPDRADNPSTMPEFFSFTPGAETNPRLNGTESAPLVVGRFRAVVPPSASTPGAATRAAQRQSARRLRGVLSSRGAERPAEAVAVHGFYNNTGYGSIAAAGYYDGIGDDEDEDEEEDEEDDVGDEDGDNDEDEGDEYGYDQGDEGAYMDDGSEGTAGGPREGSSTAASFHRSQSKGVGGLAAGPVVDGQPGWWWQRWSRWQRRRWSSASSDGPFRRPLSPTSRRRSSAATSRPQRYILIQQQQQQQQLRQHRRRIPRQYRRLLRRTTVRRCGRRVARWVRRTGRRAGRHLRNLWLTPKNATVRRAMDRWWSRWALLVVLPAALAVAWCALPFPQQPLEDDDTGDVDDGGDQPHHRAPGHGEARVRISFWFFLLAYYGPYNVTALVWITKVFNLYSLNWWPSSLGFPLSVSLLAALSLAVPAALFMAVPQAGFLAGHNTAWVTWTFAVMAMPVAAALLLLLLHERHRSVRQSLSATQRIFTSALWTSGEERDTLPRRMQRQWRLQRRPTSSSGSSLMSGRFRAVRPFAWRGGAAESQDAAGGTGPGLAVSAAPRADTVVLAFSETDALLGRSASPSMPSPPATPPPPPMQPMQPTSFSRQAAVLVATTSSSSSARGHWLPASFVRFLWLMGALFTSLLVYELGEASASLFLAALPQMQHHATAYAVLYVYAWTVTVFLLDALTGWILGGHQGERVGSYPLGWVFKLYFMLTYQTYVRALYVRLRSPSQFVLLQVLSSSTLILVTPLLMCPWTHRLLAAAGLNGQAYGAFQKVCVRNVFVRFVAENASMLAFLGSMLVLHFGPNRDVYPYLAFDDGLGGGDPAGGGRPIGGVPIGGDPTGGAGYTFSFTLYASMITWACELVAALVVSALIRYFYGLSVVVEAKMDLAVWPELLPTSVAVAVHVLQNMLFSIIRLRFW